MAVYIKFLVQVVKVASQLRTTWIAFLELEVIVDFFLEKLVDGSVGVNTSTWVTVLQGVISGCPCFY